MTTESATVSDARELQPRGLHWWALWLLVISVCINYVDRGNLGVAAHNIEHDLGFTEDQLGILLGSVFWTYALGQLVSGDIVERWNVNWVYAIGFLLWSGATALTGAANTFIAILMLRLVLGAAESVAYPAYSQIIATTFPEKLRGTANGLIDAGSKIGPAIGVYLGVKMVNAYTWRNMFILIGGISLAWLVPWVITVPRLNAIAREEAKPVRRWAPTYLQLLRERRVWGTIFGLFGANYLWYFFLTWLPYYFESERHYTKDRLAFFASIPFWAVAISSMLFGLMADWFIGRGGRPGRVRQTMVALGLLGCFFLTLPAALVKDERLSTTLLTLSCISMAAFSSNHWALTQHLAGPEAAAKWTGLENCIANFAGVVAAYLSGLTLHHFHSFIPAFVLACAFAGLGSFGFYVIVGRPEPVEWERRGGEASNTAPLLQE